MLLLAITFGAAIVRSVDVERGPAGPPAGPRWCTAQDNRWRWRYRPLFVVVTVFATCDLLPPPRARHVRWPVPLELGVAA